MSATRLKLGIHGAAGRMGRRLIALGAEDPAVQIVAALEQAGHAELGRDAGTVAGLGEIGVVLSPNFSGQPEVVIDFSEPHGALQLLERCVVQSIPLVIATTGFSTAEQQFVSQAAETLPIVWAPSMSLAVNLTMKLTSLAAQHLKDYGPGADVEIIERHHRFKEDAPSGTALRFGQLVAEQMGQTQHVHGREGRPGKRTHGEIGYHALRAGDNPGEHTIVFGLMGETMELTVKATNRDCYALGAIAAAKFLRGKPAGLYGMSDVLGL